MDYFCMYGSLINEPVVIFEEMYTRILFFNLYKDLLKFFSIFSE